MRRSNGGFTTIELMIGVALIALILGMAVPSFGAMFDRLRLTGAANELASDLQYARSEAVRRRAGVSVQPLDAGAGYVIATVDQDLKRVEFSSGLTWSGGGTIDIDALRATSSADSLELSNPAGTVRIMVSLMGRVTLCAASGDLSGYSAC